MVRVKGSIVAYMEPFIAPTSLYHLLMLLRSCGYNCISCCAVDMLYSFQKKIDMLYSNPTNQLII